MNRRTAYFRGRVVRTTAAGVPSIGAAHVVLLAAVVFFDSIADMKELKMNHYKLELPAVVSFSGGRTSGFMLRHILDAHDGQPDDLKVCFQNTGLEHAKTLDFVCDVSDQWGVDIVWLEYDLDNDNNHSFKVVDFDSASRNGEPFTNIIKWHLEREKNLLPNPIARYCTAELKVRTQRRYLQSIKGFDAEYDIIVGLRYDEPRRALRIKGDGKFETVCVPMYHAKHTEQDVLSFWKSQPFDLMLPLEGNIAGNCVGCFLKGGSKIELLMREMPEYFDWWIKAEKTVALTTNGQGAKFRNHRPSYENLIKQVAEQGVQYGMDEDDTIPSMCTD